MANSATTDATGVFVDVTIDPLASPPLLPASGITGFTVSLTRGSTGVAETLTPSAADRLSAAVVRLTLPKVVSPEDTLTVTKTGGNLTDSAGTPVAIADFTALAVANISARAGGTLRGRIMAAVGSFGVQDQIERGDIGEVERIGPDRYLVRNTDGSPLAHVHARQLGDGTFKLTGLIPVGSG